MPKLRGRVAIVGVGETEVGRVPSLSATQMCVQACRRAIRDAGLTNKDVDGVITANSWSEPHYYHAEWIAEYLGSSPHRCLTVGTGGGKLPVNTNGGLLSYAHPGNPGALLLAVEAVRQLRGECAAGKSQVRSPLSFMRKEALCPRTGRRSWQTKCKYIQGGLVPIYEYVCKECLAAIEVLQSMDAAGPDA